MWVLLAIMTLSQWGQLLAQANAAVTKHQMYAENLETASKSLDFVNKMKEDLRRNNDDYALLEGQNQLEQSPLPAHPAPQQPYRWLPTERAGLPHHNYAARRGTGDVNRDVVIQGHVNLGDVYQGTTSQGDVNQGTTYQAVLIQSNQSATEFRTFTHSRHVKSLRVSKLKKLLLRDKDKARVQDTWLNESEDMKSFMLPTTTPIRVATPAPQPPPPPPPPPSLPRRKRTTRQPAILREGRLREEKRSPFHQNLERQSPLHEDTERQSPVQEDMEKLGLIREVVERKRTTRWPQRNPGPLPDQIDMAHARNPLITRIRLKGRLCQRSLMNIEGPTYDRDGKQVMPEHDPRLARGRLFHQTRAPDLVLPKCCNCCKKSVLGCQ